MTLQNRFCARSFAYFDQDRSRTLQTNEVIQALRHAGFNLDPPVVSAMMNRWVGPVDQKE